MVMKINFTVCKNSLLEPIDLKILYKDEWGGLKTDLHSMDIKEAKRLMNELSDSINKALSNKAQRNRDKKKITNLKDLLHVWSGDLDKEQKQDKRKKIIKKPIFKM